MRVGFQESSQPHVISRITRWLVHEWDILWKITFALVAIADILGCWPVFVEGWKSAVTQKKPGVSLSSLDPLHFFKQLSNKDHEGDDTCASYSFYYEIVGKVLYALNWMGPLFSMLCILEAARRAKEAREEMLEMAALDNFEKKLARLYGSTRRLSTLAADTQQHEGSEETTYEQDDVRARRMLRFWTPVLSTLFVWSLIMPWRSMLQTDCGQEMDTALATLWITKSIVQIQKATAFVMNELVSWAWSLALPFPWWQLDKIYKRLFRLLRWVRYFRFAGPLLRILLKLSDQFFVFLKTQRQSLHLQVEKAKRELHRSMLFEDIRKIESLNKLQGLLRVPTNHIFSMAATEGDSQVGSIVQEKKSQGKKLKRQLESIKRMIRRSSDIFPSSELYDRIVDLSQELTTTVSSSLWSANLISPQTRFSLSWRVIVTCALLSEVSRICTSYQLYGRVDVTYTTMMMSVLGCEQDRGGNILTNTGRLTRKIVRQLIRLPKEQLLSTCTKSSISSHTLASMLLRMSSTFEIVIDLVCFIDIYVWFFTGELDMAGRVVPKPFFYRCVLPGTLVQIMDHPTVPDVLPNLLYYSLSAACAVGYSRMIRWLVAVGPALNLLLVDPIKRFLFRPMEAEEWLQYTESMAILPVISGADLRYAVNMSHPNLRDIQRNQSMANLRRRTSAVTFAPPTKSFVPMPLSDTARRESSSAGLNLDSQHLNYMDDSSYAQMEDFSYHDEMDLMSPSRTSYASVLSPFRSERLHNIPSFGDSSNASSTGDAIHNPKAPESTIGDSDDADGGSATGEGIDIHIAPEPTATGDSNDADADDVSVTWEAIDAPKVSEPTTTESSEAKIEPVSRGPEPTKTENSEAKTEPVSSVLVPEPTTTENSEAETEQISVE